MFSNIPIGMRIGLLVISSIFTLLLVGVAVSLGEEKISDAARDLNHHRIIFEQVSSIERRAGQLRNLASRFISTRDAAVVPLVRRAFIDIRRSLDHLKSVFSSSDETSSEVDALLQNVAAPADGFDALARTAEELGLNDFSGLRGRLRASSKEVETELATWANVEKLLVPMLTMRVMEKNFIIYGDDTFLGPHQKAFNEFDFKIDVVGLSGDAIDRLQMLVKNYKKDFMTFVAGGKKFAAEVKEFEGALMAMYPAFERLLEGARGGMIEAEERQSRVRDDVVQTTVVVLIVLVVVFITFSLMVAASLTRPLRLIETVMIRLANGDQETDIPGVIRRDEIGSMARAVQIFKDNLLHARALEQKNQAIRREEENKRKEALLEIAGSFESAFGKILSTVQTAIHRIQDGAYTLRDTAEIMKEQAENTSNKSKKTSEIVALVRQVAENLSESIGDIGGRVVIAGEAVRKAVEHTRNSDAMVRALADSSSRIGEITKIIEVIAGQTNLLALNATIEAARAGEAGRGFSVVASEVKALAGQTAKATEEIASQINAIQEATGNVVETIQNIRSTIEEVDGLSSSVSISVKRQLAETHRIVDAVREATTNTEEVSESVVTMVVKSAETGASAISMICSAGQLSEEFRQLQENANCFIYSISQ
ncbi:methyl-accepting chemotaxis protein [Azospirillaceae bacterium]